MKELPAAFQSTDVRLWAAFSKTLMYLSAFQMSLYYQRKLNTLKETGSSVDSECGVRVVCKACMQSTYEF